MGRNSPVLPRVVADGSSPPILRHWSLTIPHDIGETSPNLRLYWAERSRRNAIARAAAWASWHASGQPKARSQVQVSVLVRRRRALDQDNVWASLKAVLDGVFGGAMTPNDSPRWVRLGDIAFERWGGAPDVVLTISEILPDTTTLPP